MADENRRRRGNRTEQRPKIPEPSVTSSPMGDGNHLVVVAVANERNEPKYGVRVTFIQKGQNIGDVEATSNADGIATCVAKPGKISVIVPGFPVKELELEKPKEPDSPTFPKAPRGLGILGALARAWHDAKIIRDGGTP